MVREDEVVARRRREVEGIAKVLIAIASII